MEKDTQHVFLVGAKSLCVYGGYEIFINKLNENLKYYVACKANGFCCMDESKLEGVTRISDKEFIYHKAHCFKIHILNIGLLEAIYYDVMVLRECWRYIEKHYIKYPTVYIVVCCIGVFCKEILSQDSQTWSKSLLKSRWASRYNMDN